MSPRDSARLRTLAEAPLNAWVALSKDETRIVAVGGTYAEASEKSDAVGEPDAIIVKTPAQWAPISV